MLGLNMDTVLSKHIIKLGYLYGDLILGHKIMVEVNVGIQLGKGKITAG